MPNPSYDLAPLVRVALVVAAFAAVAVLDALCPSVWSRALAFADAVASRLERPLWRVVAALAAALAAVRLAVVRAALAPLYALANRCDWLYAAICRRRAERAVYSGLTQYEEWRDEAASLPAPLRLSVMAELSPYRPSSRLVARARILRGRNCLLTRAAERAREAARKSAFNPED